ncbi:immunoglobulin-like domain-containing protein [Kaistella carnis]|uniref:immunoglobulin-like domain-containing protein n=1 Tax=Kaistella carnis TaxID=1241979 RepID=UPI00361C69D2
MGTGNAFVIEHWNGKNWVKEKYITNRIFTSIGYDIEPGEKRVFETDVYAYYPNLKKGRYRISKSYNFDKDRPITEDEVHWIYAEFTIE